VVVELAQKTAHILPENWFLVETDSSFSVYFCETALDLFLINENIYIPNQEMYGDSFWGAPLPDSVYVVEFERNRRWSKGGKSDSRKNRTRFNAILRIDVIVGEEIANEPANLFYHYPISVRKSVPLNSAIQFNENRKPVDQCYRENGLTLQAEYQRLFFGIAYMLGIFDTN